MKHSSHSGFIFSQFDSRDNPFYDDIIERNVICTIGERKVNRYQHISHDFM